MPNFILVTQDSAVIKITGVRINGKSWNDFDARERIITLPEGKKINTICSLLPGYSYRLSYALFIN